MAASSLRRWLRRSPQPAKLRADGRDVALATGANIWARTEETIAAMNPARLEALDSNGMVLRVMTLDGAEEEKEEEGAKKTTESELVLLARIISDAHDKGASRHEEAYRIAFGEFSRLVQILAARLSGLESAWQKAMQQTAQAQADALIAQSQDGGGDPAGAAVIAMLAQATMGAGVANGSPKGAKK